MKVIEEFIYGHHYGNNERASNLSEKGAGTPGN
jgi:hypothetical protein